MLKQSRQTRTRVHQLCDGALFALSLMLAYYLRDRLANIDPLDLSPLEPFSDLAWILPVAGVLAPVFLAAQHFYTPRGANAFAATAFTALRAAALTALALVITLFLVRAQVARSVILVGCALGGVLTFLRALLTASIASSQLAREQWRERVLWLGDPNDNNRHRATLSPDETAHITDLGDFDPTDFPPERLTEILHEKAVNTVIFNISPTDISDTLFQPYLDCCTREGVSAVIRTGLKSTAPARLPNAPALDTLGGESVIHYRAHRATHGDLALKRAFDIAGSAAALFVLAPFFAFIALAIKLTSRGPALFRQTRAGLNGRAFMMLKFRTMRDGAHDEQPALAAQNEMRGPVFKIAKDPRLTPIGRFLRRHSLDEFPQFWNVLRGEMSLVGPRPLPDYEARRFDDDAHRRRQSMRPGLTCLWQISGRNDIDDFADWVRLDLAYIDTWTPWLDLRILLATIPVVLLGKGGR